MTRPIDSLVGKDVAVNDRQIITRGVLHDAHGMYSVSEWVGDHTRAAVAFEAHEVKHITQNEIYLQEREE